jgi:hypothetical protein
MRMGKRFFEQVASSISEMRDTVQNDLDRCYSVNGSIVLEQLTQRLADIFAANYPYFERDAFLKASHVPQGTGHLRDSACEDGARPTATRAIRSAWQQDGVSAEFGDPDLYQDFFTVGYGYRKVGKQEE